MAQIEVQEVQWVQWVQWVQKVQEAQWVQIRPIRLIHLIRGRKRIQRMGRLILVYRLAIDAKTRKGDDGTGWKYPSLLEDFLAGAASMARKRHLASTARGLLCFCLMAQIEVQEVQWVQWVQWVQKVQEAQWVQIRPIRGRMECTRQAFCGFCLMTSHTQDINPSHPWQNNYPLNEF